MPEGPYTTVARSLVGVAEQLTSTFAARPVGAAHRVLVVKEPLGPSTEAGKRSRQVLTLVAGPSVVAIGWLDLVNAECAVKEYPTLRLTQELRGAGPLDFTDDEYARLVSWLTAELSARGVRLRVEVIDPSELHTEKTLTPGGGRRRVDPVLLALVALLVALGAAATLLLIRRPP